MECLLCEALSNGASRTPELFNRPIFESDGFALIPALGPLLPGHVMVVSQSHCVSLAAMGLEGVAAYERHIQKLRLLRPDLMRYALEAEHGGIAAVHSGPCIVHTHINIIPSAGKFVNILDGTLDRLNVESLAALSDPSVPYFYMRSSTEMLIYNGANGRSQLVRKLILERLGNSDWNWAIFPKLEMVEETVRVWGFDDR